MPELRVPRDDDAAAFDGAVRDDPGGAVVRVHVQPRAGRAGVAGRHGAAVKVRVVAPPVGGRANDEVAAVLAGALGVAPGRVAVVGGATSRDKRVRVLGLDAAAVADRLARRSAAPGDGRRS